MSAAVGLVDIAVADEDGYKGHGALVTPTVLNR
jgi:hypothetical protein